MNVHVECAIREVGVWRRSSRRQAGGVQAMERIATLESCHSRHQSGCYCWGITGDYSPWPILQQQRSSLTFLMPPRLLSMPFVSFSLPYLAHLFPFMDRILLILPYSNFSYWINTIATLNFFVTEIILKKDRLHIVNNVCNSKILLMFDSSVAIYELHSINRYLGSFIRCTTG